MQGRRMMAQSGVLTGPQRHGLLFAQARRLAVLAVLSLTLAPFGALPHPLGRATLPPSSAIQLVSNLPSGQPVGTPVTWTALTTDTVPLLYRFSVAGGGHPYAIVRDFSPTNTFIFAPLQEGVYTIEVTVMESYGDTATVQASAPDVVLSRVSGSSAAVSPTSNPLVALYSAPSCATGQMLVAFRPVGRSTWTLTNGQPCHAGLSMNFYVAGMLPATTYQMAHVLINGTTATAAPLLTFTTGRLPAGIRFPTFSVPLPPTTQSDLTLPLLWNALGENPIKNTVSNVANPTVTDLWGRIVWYYSAPPPSGLNFVAPVQFLGHGQSFILGRDSYAVSGTNVLRQFDLAGNPVRETNVAAINAQLTAQGHEIIYGFSHDVVPLPNGDTAVLGSTLETIDGEDYMGDLLIVLHANWQVSWVWDTFNAVGPGQLDLNRQPVPGRCATYPPGICPVPDPNAADWTHANTISYSAEDGDLLVSLRNQNWVIKIDYRNGAGDGHIIWRLGQDGDFSLPTGTDPSVWFSGQHDAHYIDSGQQLTLFDDGNTRCNYGLIAGCHSRGQSWLLNEQTMVATPTVNIDLGNFSPALGSAERESNGNYDFTSGWQMPDPTSPPFGQAIEVRLDGTKVYVQQGTTQYYRSFRLPDLYHGTSPLCPTCGVG